MFSNYKNSGWVTECLNRFQINLKTCSSKSRTVGHSEILCIDFH